MKNTVIILTIFIQACQQQTIDPKLIQSSDSSECHKIIHTYFLNPKNQNADLFLMHMLDCNGDSAEAINLARQNAKMDRYWIIQYGWLGPVLLQRADTEKQILPKYNIELIYGGCLAKHSGIIYTTEMKRLLKENKGVDFSELIKEIRGY